MACFDDSSVLSVLSDCSSPLSSPANSPSPPPDYPSPPASQESSDVDSPCPDGMDSTITVSNKDGPPPAKRRRISDRKERTTEYLDLRSDTLDQEDQSQLDRLVRVLHKRRKIVVVAGAGISVSAGIPDFRSSTGLFTSLRAEHNLKGSGKNLFDASVYKDDSSTSTFHDMVRNMSKLTKDASATEFHHLLATLADEGRLLRLYTQNVDGIDVKMTPLATTVPLRKVDGKWPKTVQLHGGLAKMVCSKCKDIRDFNADLFDGPEPPVCGECVAMDLARTVVAGKRSHGIGRFRPRMVLYNEHNPDEEAIGSVVSEDLRKRPDAIIVVGTSLKIPGVKRIVREMCATVRDRRDGVAIWINNDPEPTGIEFKDCWDIVVQGTCDEVARHAAMRRWWDQGRDYTQEEHEKAKQCEPTVVINSTYKPVGTETAFKRAPSASPEFTPISVRSRDVADLAADGEDSLLGAPPTPCKSARSSPAKENLSALDRLKATSAVKKGPGRPKKEGPKASAGRPKAASKIAQSRGRKGAPQATTMKKITQTMAQSKAFSTTVGKRKTSPAKAGPKRRSSDDSDVMNNVPQKDVRRNSPTKLVTPSKSRATFPNLGVAVPKMEKLVKTESGSEANKDPRMSIDGLCN
ncbi:NAD-dependent protein deacetylase hst4 [Sphaceloma murrayae]|uniref:NAD-dependent protein deacetylase hst4 n=1 Tax=Sphaceloma murrayae TaxID=2082308 RepID=A0A2K1QY04_9PEZI|nr:NAD-dependent protein deacetylase hst4 [Sphaceloma murrayae]